MALRLFRDDGGTTWRVWDVRPTGFGGEERRRTERRTRAAAAPSGERRSGRERRVRNPTLFTPGLESGWLCFESGVERRRLTPIPAGWQGADEEALQRWLGEARPVAPRLFPLEALSDGPVEQPAS